jgi:hypothetical protein
MDSVRDGLTVTNARLRQELFNLSLCFNALVEDGKLSIDDLRARVNCGDRRRARAQVEVGSRARRVGRREAEVGAR